MRSEHGDWLKPTRCQVAALKRLADAPNGELSSSEWDAASGTVRSLRDCGFVMSEVRRNTHGYSRLTFNRITAAGRAALAEVDRG